MRQKQSPSETIVAADEPVPYRLVFRHGERAAKLTSPSLDRAMHARGGVDVVFDSLSRQQDDDAIKLDPFESRSLIAYLQNQEGIRRALERELDLLLESWDQEMEVGRGHDVWRQTKIEGVHFAPRFLATPEQVRYIKKAHKADAKKLLREEFDTPESRSSFTVLMTPKWAEHLLMVQFRDDEAMELKVDG
jgi:hypothetical protein